jgi:ABC-type multidrug transport system ATPase subunit
MHGKLRGKCVYLAELDFHFPTLTMRETLEFGAKVRKSGGDSEQSRRRAEATAAQLGLAKALETNMGNDLVPGVSGGERKRASIAVRYTCHMNGGKLSDGRKFSSATAISNAGITALEGLTVKMPWTS